MTRRRFRTALTVLAALVLAACASDSRPPAASAVPHGTTLAQPVTVESLIDSLGMPVDCPEQDPAQPNCRVPR